MEHRGITTVIIVLIVLVVFGYWFSRSPARVAVREYVTNFTECQRSGYPVTASYPRQCRTPSGQIFAENIITSGSEAAVYAGLTSAYPSYPSYNSAAYPAYSTSSSAYTYTEPRAYITYPIATSTGSSYSVPRTITYPVSSSTSYSYYQAPGYYSTQTYQIDCSTSDCSDQIYPGGINNYPQCQNIGQNMYRCTY